MQAARPLCALQFATTSDYSHNLDFLLNALATSDTHAIIVAPEVCLTDFAYDNFEAAIAFSQEALPELLEAVTTQLFIFTMLERREDGVYNVAKVLHQGKVIHEQAKSKLFKLGDEHHYFSEGNEKEILLFELEGIKIGILICFELRFKHLWMQVEGADIIAITARWGKLRSDAFETLSRGLALMNQCYVIATDASNDECSGRSGIISPMGDEVRNGNATCLSVQYNQKEIKRMRRYLDVGIHG